MFCSNSAPRENRIKLLVTTQRMKILTFYALPCVFRHSHLSFPCFRILQVISVPVIKNEGKYTQSWLKPFLTWKIIWDFNAIDQTWVLMMIFVSWQWQGLMEMLIYPCPMHKIQLSLVIPLLFGLIFSSVPLMKSPGPVVFHPTWQVSHGYAHLNPENLLGWIFCLYSE